MNKNDVSIATITLARDEKEEQLLRNSLRELAKLEIPVFITDGGSQASFLAFLKGFSHFKISEAKVKGVWEQAKTSLFQAFEAGTKFIFYTEPDKYDFFHSSISAMLHRIQTDEKSGVVTASRSAVGFNTFPDFQRMTETTINNCCSEIIGGNFDYTYGPFLLNRELVPFLKLVNEDIGWGWRPYMFSVANRLGFRVDPYIGDFACPAEQRQDSGAERIYRMRQLAQNIQGIVLSASVSLNTDLYFKQ
jgi:hypothetical protein